MSIEQHLNELGVIARPASAPPAPKPEPRPDPRLSPGIYYPDGNIPH